MPNPAESVTFPKSAVTFAEIRNTAPLGQYPRINNGWKSRFVSNTYESEPGMQPTAGCREAAITRRSRSSWTGHSSVRFGQ